MCGVFDGSFGFWLNILDSEAVLTATANDSSALVSINATQMYPIWASSTTAYDFSSSPSKGESIASSGYQSGDSWYWVTVTVGDANTADRSGCVTVSGDRCIFYRNPDNWTHTSGWKAPAYLNNYYYVPLNFIMVVPPQTEVTMTLRYATDLGWEFGYKGQSDPSYIVIRHPTTGNDPLVETIPAKPDAEIYEMYVDSSSATDENCEFFIESSGQGSAQLFPVDGYYFKRRAGSAGPSVDFSVSVDANEVSSFDVTRLEDNKFTGNISLLDGSGNELSKDTWTTDYFSGYFPKSPLNATYIVRVQSTQTHLGPGPFIAPTAPVPVPYGRHPTISYPVPPLTMMQIQGGGVWRRRLLQSTLTWVWVFELGSLMAYNVGGSSPSWTATDFNTGAALTLTDSDLAIVDVTNNATVWVPDISLQGIDDVVALGATHLPTFNQSAVYEEHRSGVGDTLDVTWTQRPESELHFRNSAGYAIEADQYPSVWSFSSLPTRAGAPSVVNLVPPPNAPNNRWYSGRWRFSGDIMCADGTIGAVDVGGWTFEGLDGYTVPRPVVHDNIGSVQLHVSGWASIG